MARHDALARPERSVAAGSSPYPAGSGLLDRLESGVYQAVLIDLHRFEGYRRNHHQTRIKLSDYLHPVGFNL
jgi:hypothetical protein